MQTGQATVTEPITASTEIGTHRLHPLPRTSMRWSRKSLALASSSEGPWLPSRDCLAACPLPPAGDSFCSLHPPHWYTWAKNLLHGTAKSTGQPSQVRASVGILQMAQRRAQIARQRRRYAQRRLEEERDGGESRRKPSFIRRVWEEIRNFIVLPDRR
jgi:hypothetical protein